MAYVSTTPIARKGFANRLVALRDIAVGSVLRRRTYARTVAELNALTDRELTDLGISRVDIRSIAHEAAYGK
jgi:uncharacterized protein YjiS (DUF1127 family)